MEDTEFIPLINKCVLNLNKHTFKYMYTICIFDLKNCYCYYKIFEVYRTVLNVSKSFTFILFIACNFKSIYKRSYKLLFLVLMTAFLQYVCFLIKIKIFFPNFLFWDILSLWNPMGSLDHSNEVLRKYKPCVMNKK